MPLPLAVGMLHLPDHALAERRVRARIDISVRASREGYALIDTFDTDSRLGPDAAYAALLRLTQQHEVQAVLVLGEIDLDRIRALAGERSLITLEVLEAIH